MGGTAFFSLCSKAATKRCSWMPFEARCGCTFAKKFDLVALHAAKIGHNQWLAQNLPPILPAGGGERIHCVGCFQRLLNLAKLLKIVLTIFIKTVVFNKR